MNKLMVIVEIYHEDKQVAEFVHGIDPQATNFIAPPTESVSKNNSHCRRSHIRHDHLPEKWWCCKETVCFHEPHSDLTLRVHTRVEWVTDAEDE